MNLIDKDALVAEIKRRMDENRGKQSLPQYFGMIEEDLNILSFINTLDVKEVDLEKFTEKINTFQARYKHPEITSIKGAMAWMFCQYPNVARELVCKETYAKEKHLKIAFEQTFGKPFDADKVYKKRLTRFIMQTDNTEYYSYCNRVFLIVRQNYDFGIENPTCSLSFEIPIKLYYTRKNGRVEFIDKASK